MIYYDLNTINDWNFGDDNIIKVYRNNAVCYYKITGGGDTPTAQTPCFAVVDDISQYSDTEFEDVFNLADEKWYKVNNLNQYEEYGIYGSGRTITTYDGKLTIDDGYEYMYSGGSWINVGEVSGSSVTIKSPEYIQRTSSFNGYCSLLEYLTEDTKIIIKHRQTNAGGGRIIGDYNSNDNDDWRFFFYGSTLYYDFITQRKSTSKSMPMSAAEEWEVGNYYIKNTATSTNLITGTPQTFSSRPAPLYIYHSDGVGAGESGADYGEIYYIKIYKNDVLVRDFIPWTDMNGNYGLYDKVEGELVHTVGNMTASTVINDVEVGGGQTEYPLEYVVREDPPDNLIFSSMEEAEAYECPWVGMSATINGDKYVFSGDSQSGYEWVYNPSRLPSGYTEVEYIESTNRINNTQSTTRFNVLGDNTSGNTYTFVYELPSDAYSASYYAYLFGNNSVYYFKLDNGWGSQKLEINYFGRASDTSPYTPVGTKVEMVVTKDNITITDVQTSSSQTYNYTSSRSYTSVDRFGIFCIYNKNDAYCSTGKIYELKIESINGVVLNDYIPATRDSDMKVGLYDIVGNAFYYDESGTLTIVAGQPI